jgi:uncharacterized membrane protein YgaE (UPF0421/DUF939 family)
VLSALRGILDQIGYLTDASTPAAPGWTLTAADRLHRQLARLIEARGTAEQLARAAPLRWPLRSAVRTADRQAARLALLASSVLHLAGTLTAGSHVGPLAEPLRAAISDLAAAGAALADDEPAIAAAHGVSARRRIAAMHPDPQTTTEILQAAVIDSCADELQQVLDLLPE